MNFRVLTEIQLVKQPQKSNWCWAACGEMILKSFNIGVNESNSKCAFMSDYTGQDCCPENLDDCNKSILIDDVEQEFEKKGITVTNYHNKLQDFDFIKNHLEQSKTPLILGLVRMKDAGNHMVLVYGYGKCEQYEYLLILDPIGRRYFVRFQTSNLIYADTYQFRYLWTTDLDVPKREMQNIDGPRFSSDDLTLEENTIVNFGYLDTNFDLKFRSENVFLHLSSSLNKENNLGSVCYRLNNDSVCNLRYHYSNVDYEIIQKALEHIYSIYRIGEVKLRVLDIESHMINAILISRNNEEDLIYPYHIPENYGLERKIQEYNLFVETVKSKEKAKAFIN